MALIRPADVEEGGTTAATSSPHSPRQPADKWADRAGSALPG